jgi:hypothetical protein
MEAPPENQEARAGIPGLGNGSANLTSLNTDNEHSADIQELHSAPQLLPFDLLDVGSLLRLAENIELLLAREVCSQAEVTTLRNWFSSLVDRRDILNVCDTTIGVSPSLRDKLEAEFRALARVVAALNKRRLAA